jgi:hypothetical protein
MMSYGFFIFSVISMIAIAVYGIIALIISDKKNVDVDLPGIPDILDY